MPRPPVTCHILDTTSGKPAQGVVCSIYKLNVEDVSCNEDTVLDAKESAPFALARTDSDGRVGSWVFIPDVSKRTFLKEIGIVEKDSHLEWRSLVPGFYKIRFQTGKYFARENKTCFFPFVEIAFEINDTKHYHIPLLLSNFGYTTYRGS
ncbi:LANO_0F03224g1_1 [Lachancea nothofagi CBS 11611]|uniref:5-hydroxyisourate hydrolase n=1 Tax=Lachancea nothofagi CBS 11611 TaxID=1266666 RepID=A0A1G4K711_9SACH|nr:LANO_0F03224g1_1 [Lachancea nothofagi CBS 11611]